MSFWKTVLPALCFLSPHYLLGENAPGTATLPAPTFMVACEATWGDTLNAALRKMGLERDGVLISDNAIDGYSAAFNPDVQKLPNSPDQVLAAVRLARAGYDKTFTGTGLRGYEFRGPYISDVGLGLVNLIDGKPSFEFLGILAATDYLLNEQIARVQKIASEHPNEVVDKVLTSLQQIANGGKNVIPPGLVLEDPRFQSDANGDLYLFVTAVPKSLLSGESNGAAKTETYGMAAMKIALTNDRAQPLKVEWFKTFGPPENKDTGFFPIKANDSITAEISRMYIGLGLATPPITSPVMMLTRVNSAIQMIPFPSLAAALELPTDKWQEIYSRGLYRRVFQADKKLYRSVGNNDQPMPIPGMPGHLLYMIHATEAQQFDPARPDQPTLSYVTYAAILTTQGDVVAVSPTPIQTPKAGYEVKGDVNWVLFNSGNTIVNNNLVLFNGAADSVVAFAHVSLPKLVDYVMQYGRINNYNPQQGVVIGRPPANVIVP